jgi:cytoskeletal protein CcmA (bactofilin family)
MPNLIDMLPKDLKEGLTEAEAMAIRLAPIGKEADFRVKDVKGNDAGKAEEWGDNRTLRAEFLYWLCTDEQATKLVHAKGVMICGAKVEGVLDFEEAHLPRSLTLAQSAIPKGIILRDATVRSVGFSASHTGPVSSNRLKAKGVVALNGIHAKGEVCLQGASINGDLISDDASFKNCGGIAFNADGLSVGGSVFLNRIRTQGQISLECSSIGRKLSCNEAVFENPKGIAFNADGLYVGSSASLCNIKAKGEVRLLCASITTQLLCTGAVFENPKGKAFNADGLSVGGSAFLDQIKTKGEVRLSGACIGSDLSCEETEFDNPPGNAFVAESLSIKGNASLCRIKARGLVCLTGAAIGGRLTCDDADFDNSQFKDSTAFNADNLSTTGNVSLCRIVAKGEVSIVDASIGAILTCEGAKFDNPGANAFTADRLSAEGSVHLRGTNVKGVVRLVGASIGGNLECNDSEFKNHKDRVLIADRLSVRGNISLRKLKTEGEIFFCGTTVTGNLECHGARFSNEKAKSFNAPNLQISRDLVFNSETEIHGILDLKGAHVNRMADHQSNWPKAGQLYLDGFQYESFAGETTPMSAIERIEWLRLQPEESFRPQPYEQLAKVFRRLGRESDVRRVLIAKQDAFRKQSNLYPLTKIWKWLFKKTVDYGYRPWLAFVYILFFVLVGWGIFHWANSQEIMRSKLDISKKMGYVKNPQFAPLAYSIDVFLPIVNLHQEREWLPDVTKPSNKELWGKPWGYWIRFYFWLHIILGWVLSTLAVASLAGLVRKE